MQTVVICKHVVLSTLYLFPKERKRAISFKSNKRK